MYDQLWNPFFLPFPLQQQEEPLDLSVKKERSSEPASLVKPNFDFQKFYDTYCEISSRSLPVLPHFDAPKVREDVDEISIRKRKYSTDTCESDETVSGDEKRIKVDDQETAKKLTKKSKSLKRAKDKNAQISDIKKSCDCRFCYEDHIIKLRLKTEKPWATYLKNQL